MALKTTHQPAEAILAADMNSVVTLAIQNAHNIFELFLENFFAAKITPFNGLFFDGFSDTTKADIAATTLAKQAASGQAELEIPLNDAAQFSVSAPNITIFDSTNAEEKLIQSLSTGAAEAIDQSQTSGASFLARVTNVSNYFAQNIVMGASGVITKVDLFMGNGGLGAEQLKMEIQGVDVNNKPDGVVKATSDTLSFTNTNSIVKRTFLFTGTKAAVAINDKIAIVMVIVAFSTDSYDLEATAANTYLTTAEQAWESTDAGATWADITTPGAAEDLRFNVFVEGLDKITLTTNLANTFAIGDGVKRSTVNIDTGGKKIDFTGIDVGNDKAVVYYSKLQSFQTAMASTRLWIVRNFTAQFNLAANISAGATTLKITGDQTGKFANGDIIDISTSNNLTRERKTLTATPTFAAGETTLTFAATTNAFTTTAFVERVDVIPQISVENAGDPESFNAMTFVRSIVDFTNSEVEDEYSFEPGTPNEDVTVKLALTREDVALIPFAKRLGVSLSE